MRFATSTFFEGFTDMQQTFKRLAIATALGVALSTQTGIAALNPVSTAQAQTNTTQGAALNTAQLQSLVSPIALYPDDLLSQMLMAATYPLEVAEAYNWLESEKGQSKDQIQTALKNETWDNSVKSLVMFPQALDLMGSKLSWTQQLGDAYLAQPKALMDAIQSLRHLAQKSGNLNSSQQVTINTQGNNITIAPANPQVVYVPQYNPTIVYGSWPYPAYPPASAYDPAWGLMSFGVGMAVGAALWSSPRWGAGSITINNNNFNQFNRNYNSDINRASERIGSDSAWRFSPAHRGNVPFNNAELNRRYGDISQQDRIARNQADRLRARQDNWMQNATPAQRDARDQLRARAREQFSSAGFDDRTDAFRGDRFGGDRMRGGFGGARMGGFRR